MRQSHYNTGDKAEQVLDRYNKNLILSEAMTPVLHYLEFCLKNHIDQTLGSGIPLGLIFESFDLTAEKALMDGMIQKIYLRKNT